MSRIEIIREEPDRRTQQKKDVKTDLSEEVGSSCEMWSNCFSSRGMGGTRVGVPFIDPFSESFNTIASDIISPPPVMSIGLPGPEGGRCSYWDGFRYPLCMGCANGW